MLDFNPSFLVLASKVAEYFFTHLNPIPVLAGASRGFARIREELLRGVVERGVEGKSLVVPRGFADQQAQTVLQLPTVDEMVNRLVVERARAGKSIDDLLQYVRDSDTRAALLEISGDPLLSGVSRLRPNTDDSIVEEPRDSNPSRSY